jgi:hypothetical protein
MFYGEHAAGDADAFWLILIVGVVTVISIILAICFDRRGNPRRWLINRMKRAK